MLAEQIRGARAILRMEQAELAELAGVSTPTIRRLEAMDGMVRGVRPTTIEAIKKAFEKRGVAFRRGASSWTISVRTQAPSLDRIFHEMHSIVPEYEKWVWDSNTLGGPNFIGVSKRMGKTMLISVRQSMSQMEDALRKLREARGEAEDVELGIVVMGAPYDGRTADGIRVFTYPRQIEMDLAYDEAGELIDDYGD